MNMVLTFVVLFFGTSTHALFDHSRAVALMQQGKFEQAKPLLQRLVTDNPDDAAIMYDAGVLAYKLNDFEQAGSYFKHVAENASSQQLKERAYFNAGNTAVELKKLQEAIELYEKALTLNPHNEQAQHNLEKVKEMLKKEQEQQQNKDQQKNQDQKQDQEKNKSEQEQQKQDKEQSKENKQDQQKGQQENKQQEEQKDGQQPEQQEQKQQQNREAKNDKSNGKQDQSGTEQKRDSEQQQQQKTEEEKKHNKPESKKNEQSVPEKQDKVDEEKKQAAQVQQDKQDKKLEGWLAQLLDEQGKKDAQANKAMMRSVGGQENAGDDGQNNW